MRSKAPEQTHWFFLRGLGRESGHWGDFLARFEAALPGARATALDLPGFGTRAAETCPLSIAGIVDSVQDEFAELRRLDPGRAPFLFTVSLGGMVAAEWLARAPDAFAGAVLVNSSFRGWSPVLRRLTPEACGRLLGIASSRQALERERGVLSLVSNRPEIRERVAEEWAEIERARPIRLENFLRQLWAASRFQPQKEPLATPALVLWSEGDRMVHPSCSQEIARRWKVPMRRHPTAGHDLPLDAPDWTIEQTLEWMRSLHPPPSPQG